VLSKKTGASIGRSIGAPAPASSDRVAYLAEVRDLLWPDQGAAGRRSRAGELIVVPSLADPRLLVPAGRRAGAAAVRRYGEPGSRRARLGTRALSLALASGAGRVLLRDRLRTGVPAGPATIEAHLAAQLGREVRLSLHLGAARANRKPVLQVLTPGGATVAFAKVAYTPLTRQLVRDERAALDHIAAVGLSTAAAPAVLHFGTWAGLDVLVLSALPVWRPRRELAAGQLAAAMGEVARVAGCTSQPLAAGDYWSRLSRRLAGVPAGQDQLTLQRLLDELGRQSGDHALTFGAWHGDWTPWNMACTRDGLLVWDWERFATGVPVGFDALHYWLQTAVVSRRDDPAAAAADCVRQAPGLLRPLGVDLAAARLTALLYLCELSTRYLVDRQAEAGARLGTPGHWLIPALAAAIAAQDVAAQDVAAQDSEIP
jgi:hypothetical protein